MTSRKKPFAELTIAILAVAGALLACKSDDGGCPARYKLLSTAAAGATTT